MQDLAELRRSLETLEQRIARLEAVQAIHRLKARYSALIDSRYTLEGPVARDALEEIATRASELFTPDAVWDGGEQLGRWEGRDAIRKRFLDPTLHFTLHYFVQPHIEVAGESAHGTWDILSPITFGNGRPGFMAGREADAYRLHEGTWLHSHMELTVHFLGPDLRGWDRRPRD